MKLIKKNKGKKWNIIVIIILLIIIVIVGIMIFMLNYHSNKQENPKVSETIERPETEQTEDLPEYITESCYDGSKEVDPVLYSFPFDKGIYEYINNKELVQKINSKEIDLLQEKADGCIKMMFGTNSNTILSDYDNTERSMLNLFKEGTTWHDEADNDKSIDIYVADYLKALADNRYQADYQYQTDKSLIWFNNCYYVRGLVQLKVQECKDGRSLIDYYPITLEKGKTYRFIVDLGFSISVVNETKEYTLTEINYILAEESEEDISDPELLEVK